jgi:hypothetical protein
MMHTTFLFNYSTRLYEEIHLPTGRHLPGNNSCRYTYKIDEGMAMIGAPQVPQGDVKCPRVTSISRRPLLALVWCSTKLNSNSQEISQEKLAGILVHLVVAAC